MQVDIVLQLLAEVRLLVDQADQAILDLQEDFGAPLNSLVENALGFDDQGFATEEQSWLACVNDKHRE